MIITNRRGVSQIMGSLFMITIVTSVGTILLFTGIENVENFNSFLDNIRNTEIDKINESFILEHVRFDPVANSGEKIELSIRNTGSVDIVVDRIAIHQIENQVLIIYDTDPNLEIFTGEIKTQTYTDWIGADIDITDIEYADKQYRVSVTTSRGTTVETITKAFNT